MELIDIALYIAWGVVIIGVLALITKRFGIEPVEKSLREDSRKAGILLAAASFLAISLESKSFNDLLEMKIALLVLAGGILFLIIGNMKATS